MARQKNIDTQSGIYQQTLIPLLYFVVIKFIQGFTQGRYIFFDEHIYLWHIKSFQFSQNRIVSLLEFIIARM